ASPTGDSGQGVRRPDRPCNLAILDGAVVVQPESISDQIPHRLTVQSGILDEGRGKPVRFDAARGEELAVLGDDSHVRQPGELADWLTDSVVPADAFEAIGHRLSRLNK